MYLFGLNYKSFKTLTNLKLLKIHELVLRFHPLQFFLLFIDLENLISKFMICFIHQFVKLFSFNQHNNLHQNYQDFIAH